MSTDNTPTVLAAGGVTLDVGHTVVIDGVSCTVTAFRGQVVHTALPDGRTTLCAGPDLVHLAGTVWGLKGRIEAPAAPSDDRVLTVATVATEPTPL